MATDIQKEELEATTAEIAANKRPFLLVYDKTLNSMQYILADGSTVRDLLTLDSAGANTTLIKSLSIGEIGGLNNLHVFDADSGLLTADFYGTFANHSAISVESDGTAVLQLGSPTAGTGILAFSRPGAKLNGGLTYNHTKFGTLILSSRLLCF